MATTAPAISTGATFTFSGFSGNIISASWSGVTRASVNTTHLGTAIAAGQTFMPGDLTDWGEVSITFQFDPAAATNWLTLFQATTTSTLHLEAPDDTAGGAAGDFWEAPAFVIGLEWEVPEFDSSVLTGTATFKIAGSPTISAG